jgi:hypothetical protein
MYTYRDIKNYIQLNGWIHFLILPLRRIKLKYFNIENGVIYFFIPENVPLRPPDSSIIIRRATIDDLEKLREINPNTTLFRNFLNNNDIFIIALSEEKVIGHSCITKVPPEKFKNLIKININEAWHREAFVRNRFQNKGIYSMIFSYAAQIADGQGYTKVYSDIISNNRKSIELHIKKFGFIPVLNYVYLKFLFFERTRLNEIQS